MIINEYEINDIRDNHRLDEIYKESLFIDIETTGLSKIYSDIISITLLVYKDDKFRIYQIFCQNKSDQPQTLKYLKDLMKSKKYIITYNGNSFDIPFLAEKSKQFGTGLDFESLTKIDLYLLMKKLKYKINIVDLKLKTVEEYFCIERNDTIGGMDVVTLYEAYKLEPRKEFSDLILLHNYEDVNNLPLVMNNIFALYDDVIYLRNLIVTINYDGLSIKKNLIQCNFNVITAIDKDFINHSINYDMILSVDNQTLVINISLHTYKDETIGEFYYLDNNEYELKTYTGLKGIKRNLIPIRINDKIYIDNIKSIVRKILEEGFGCSEKQVVTL
jgi:uncharacterized protein YprB with RNaseH-like and TPR domain